MTTTRAPLPPAPRHPHPSRPPRRGGAGRALCVLALSVLAGCTFGEHPDGDAPESARCMGCHARDYHGARGHEIMFVYEAAFTLPQMYDRDEYLIIEGETASVARWVGLEEFRFGRAKLFPAGLTDILARERDFARSTAAFEVGEAK